MEGLLISYGPSDFLSRPVENPAISSPPRNLPRDQQTSLPVPGVSVSRLNGTDPLEFTLHPTSKFLLIARLSGRSGVRYSIGTTRRECDIRYGHMLIYSPSERSYWRVEHPNHTVILSIPGQLLQRAWEQDRKGTWPGMAETGSFSQDAQVIQILATLISELDRLDQVNSAYSESVLFQLSTHLVRRYSKTVDSVVRHSGMSPSRLNRVLDYVETGLEEQLRLDAMAEVAGISPYYFCREFKKTMGITPYGYIVQQRIGRAKALLQNTSMSITEIGAQLLFATPSHFTATFRKLVGCTPTIFRSVPNRCVADSDRSSPSSSMREDRTALPCGN
jgi:AraC family transcriptional regulator